MVKRYIICDKCGNNQSYSANPSINLLKKWARDEGWSCGINDLCPSCNSRNRKKQN